MEQAAKRNSFYRKLLQYGGYCRSQKYKIIVEAAQKKKECYSIVQIGWKLIIFSHNIYPIISFKSASS